LGIGDWGLGPIPNPQSPIPNPQSPIPNISKNHLLIYFSFNYLIKLNELVINLNKKMSNQDSLEKEEKEVNSIVYGLLKNNLKIISIKKLPFIIGRNEKSDLVINNPSISKKHAVIQFDEGDEENNNMNKDKNIILIDNSLNGTYVNGIKITNGKKILLETGDKISFGNDKIIYIFELMNYDNDKTVIYPNMFGYNKIESKPISLVNEDYYQKSEINHFNGQINLKENENDENNKKNEELEIEVNKDNLNKDNQIENNKKEEKKEEKKINKKGSKKNKSEEKSQNEKDDLKNSVETDTDKNYNKSNSDINNDINNDNNNDTNNNNKNNNNKNNNKNNNLYNNIDQYFSLKQEIFELRKENENLKGEINKLKNSFENTYNNNYNNHNNYNYNNLNNNTLNRKTFNKEINRNYNELSFKNNNTEDSLYNSNINLLADDLRELGLFRRIKESLIPNYTELNFEELSQKFDNIIIEYKNKYNIAEILLNMENEFNNEISKFNNIISLQQEQKRDTLNKINYLLNKENNFQENNYSKANKYLLEQLNELISDKETNIKIINQLKGNIIKLKTEINLYKANNDKNMEIKNRFKNTNNKNFNNFNYNYTQKKNENIRNNNNKFNTDYQLKDYIDFNIDKYSIGYNYNKNNIKNIIDNDINNEYNEFKFNNYENNNLNSKNGIDYYDYLNENENKLMNDYTNLNSLLPDNKKYKEIIKQKQLIVNGIK